VCLTDNPEDIQSELQLTTFRLTSGVHSLNLLRWMYTVITVCTEFVEYSGFFVFRTASLHRRAGSDWRVPFELQRIHRYTEMNVPIISDFANVYLTMTISLSFRVLYVVNYV
jgi:hypothetical protein